MGMHQQLITDSLYDKAVEDFRALAINTRKLIRLQIIISAKKYGITLVARINDITSNTIREWVKKYEKFGLKGLEYQDGRGRKSNVSEEHLEIVRKWLQDDCNITIKQIVLKLQEEYDVKTSKSAMQRLGTVNKLYQ